MDTAQRHWIMLSTGVWISLLLTFYAMLMVWYMIVLWIWKLIHDIVFHRYVCWDNTAWAHRESGGLEPATDRSSKWRWKGKKHFQWTRGNEWSSLIPRPIPNVACWKAGGGPDTQSHVQHVMMINVDVAWHEWKVGQSRSNKPSHFDTLHNYLLSTENVHSEPLKDHISLVW